MLIMLSSGELKKVELILPPPARLDAGAAEGALPRSTQKALGRLLSACGLSADFTGGLALHLQLFGARLWCSQMPHIAFITASL